MIRPRDPNDSITNDMFRNSGYKFINKDTIGDAAVIHISQYDPVALSESFSYNESDYPPVGTMTSYKTSEGKVGTFVMPPFSQSVKYEGRSMPGLRSPFYSGRLYPSDTTSDGSANGTQAVYMAGAVRNKLVSYDVIDIDIKNCIPSIILQVASELGQSHRVVPLQEYSDKREDLYLFCETEQSITKEQIKELFNAVTNGGSVRRWIDEVKPPNSDGVTRVINLARRVEEGMRQLVRHMIALPQFDAFKNSTPVTINDKEAPFEKVKAEDKQSYLDRNVFLRKFGARVWQTIEAQITYAIVTHTKFDIASWIYDGFHVRAPANEADAICSEFMNIARGATGFDVVFAHKPIERGHSLVVAYAVDDKMTDVALAEAFRFSFPEHAKRLGQEQLLLFDDLTNIWTESTDLQCDIIWRTGMFEPANLTLNKTVYMLHSIRSKAGKDTDDDFEQKLNRLPNGQIPLFDAIYDAVIGEFRPYEKNDYCTFKCKYKVEDDFRDDLIMLVEQLTNLLKGNTDEIDECYDGHLRGLKKILPEHGLFVNVIRFLGYALFTTDKDSEKYLEVMGNSSNGKSKLVSILSAIFGELIGTITTANLSDYSDNSDKAPWVVANRFKHLLFCGEAGSRKSNISMEAFKAITGRDVISGRELYSKKIHKYIPPYALMFVGNDIVKLDNDDAINRRRLAYTFPSKFSDVDDPDNLMFLKEANFADQFLTENGKLFIFALMVSGFRYWKEHKFTPVPSKFDNFDAIVENGDMTLDDAVKASVEIMPEDEWTGVGCDIKPVEIHDNVRAKCPTAGSAMAINQAIDRIFNISNENSWPKRVKIQGVRVIRGMKLID